MMNFNILMIYRHLEIFDNFRFFIEVSKLEYIRLNNVSRGFYNLYVVGRNRHCDVTLIRV